jgi:hypothetical protein
MTTLPSPLPSVGHQVASAVFDLDGEGEGVFPRHRHLELVGKDRNLRWARHKQTRSYGLDCLLFRLKFSSRLGHILRLEYRNRGGQKKNKNQGERLSPGHFIKRDARHEPGWPAMATSDRGGSQATHESRTA